MSISSIHGGMWTSIPTPAVPSGQHSLTLCGSCLRGLTCHAPRALWGARQSHQSCSGTSGYFRREPSKQKGRQHGRLTGKGGPGHAEGTAFRGGPRANLLRHWVKEAQVALRGSKYVFTVWVWGRGDVCAAWVHPGPTREGQEMVCRRHRPGLRRQHVVCQDRKWSTGGRALGCRQEVVCRDRKLTIGEMWTAETGSGLQGQEVVCRKERCGLQRLEVVYRREMWATENGYGL